MNNRALFSILLACLIPNFAFGWQDIQQASQTANAVAELTPTEAPEFKLSSLDGGTCTLPNESKFTVVCFLGIECPLAKLYSPRLRELDAEFRKHGIQFIGINSNQQDSESEFLDFANSNGIEFPVAKDFDNIVADKFSVKRTPEVFVVDQNLTIHYRGRIDDQYSPGVTRNKAQRNDLKIALQELLAGKSVSVKRTDAEGCLLGRVRKTNPDSDVTFAKQVSRILQNHCVECHRDDDIGPFALDQYEEVVGWADMIVETIDNGRMPPWHADPNHGKFANERRMTDAEKDSIRKWVDNGAPFGSKEDLPQPVERVSGWRLPTAPDQVIAMSDKAFHIPAGGTVEYQYFVVDPGFTEDKWVTAAEVIPGNRGVVHHSIVFIRPPDGKRLNGVGWLTAYVPGQRLLQFKQGRARRIPAGSKLVFQQHYTPNGSEQDDITKLGMVFAKPTDVTEEIFTLIAINQEFEIKPNESNKTVSASVRSIPTEGQLLSVSPHMHFRGKSFVAWNGDQKDDQAKPETLLKVPNYDFNWQHTYEFEKPIPLSELRSLSMEVTFDNSNANPFNPDPEQYVLWGDQTWEEMAIAFFDVSVPRNDNQRVAQRRLETQQSKESASAREESRNKKAKEFAVSFFERFDNDTDGLITREELPVSIRSYGFRRYDRNRSGDLTPDEIETEAKSRF
ncbi:MAG: redoxin domain-containing protein [Mariniblastus sp.]